jgi:hypothetical protein
MNEKAFPIGARASPALAALNPMTPIRVSSGTILSGEWQGPLLNEYQLKASVFSGPHYLLHLGYRSDVFMLMFIVRYPVTSDFDDPVVRADAERVAAAFVDMLNASRLKETS